MDFNLKFFLLILNSILLNKLFLRYFNGILNFLKKREMLYFNNTLKNKILSLSLQSICFYGLDQADFSKFFL